MKHPDLLPFPISNLNQPEFKTYLTVAAGQSDKRLSNTDKNRATYDLSLVREHTPPINNFDKIGHKKLPDNALRTHIDFLKG